MARESSGSVAPPRTVGGVRRTAADRAATAFTSELFAGLARADQRRWAHAYTRGLLVTPGRKTVRAIAARVSDSATAAQALHQFVNASPWPWEPVRARLAEWVVRHAPPGALVVRATLMPKRGERSCGVHRRFAAEEGRTVNCQLGIGAFLVGSAGAVPVDWRLLLPGRWSQDARLRGTARVPAELPRTPQSVVELAAELVRAVDGLLARPAGTALPVLVDLPGCADPDALVEQLAARGRFAVSIAPDQPLLPEPRTAAPAAAARPARLLWQSRPTAPGPFSPYAGPVRLPQGAAAVRLIAERRHDGTVRRCWLADRELPPGEVTSALPLASVAEATATRLEDVGLRAFEGRSFPGWHHHMTLVSAAWALRALGHPGAVPEGFAVDRPRPAVVRHPAGSGPPNRRSGAEATVRRLEQRIARVPPAVSPTGAPTTRTGTP